MKRVVTTSLCIVLLLSMASCGILGIGGDTVAVAKPRLHKSWPKTHRWHRKVKVWKYYVQMPERKGVKTVKMKN